jgi:thiosulfate/3-mercaptopyruvate sulfurtransferase
MRDPRALIDTAGLAAALGDPALRVFDCTTTLEPTPAGSAEPYIAVPGRKTFEDGHVPGADFLDLQGEFSDPTTHLHFMMPPVARLEAAFGPARHRARHARGALQHRHDDVGDTLLVDAARARLRRTRPCSTAASTNGRPRAGRSRQARRAAIRRRASLARPREGLFVDAASVKAADRAQRHRDRSMRSGAAVPSRPGASRYGRRAACRQRQRAGGDAGRSRDQGLHHARRRGAKFAAQGVSKDKRTICYCGGGISATIDLFLLHQLGHDDITLLRRSMGEWAKTPTLPIETD